MEGKNHKIILIKNSAPKDNVLILIANKIGPAFCGWLHFISKYNFQQTEKSTGRPSESKGT